MVNISHKAITRPDASRSRDRLRDGNWRHEDGTGRKRIHIRVLLATLCSIPYVRQASTIVARPFTTSKTTAVFRFAVHR